MTDRKSLVGRLLDIMNDREAPVAIQFLKYGIVGGVATGINLVLFYICAYFIWPSLGPDDPFITLLKLEPPAGFVEDLRLSRVQYSMVTAFMISNLACYLMNVKWVFVAGRHHWILEVLLFYAVSGLAFVAGAALASFLIGRFEVQTTYANLSNILTSVLINFILRKFAVFKQ